jgi:hypothetical protein
MFRLNVKVNPATKFIFYFPWKLISKVSKTFEVWLIRRSQLWVRTTIF